LVVLLLALFYFGFLVYKSHQTSRDYKRSSYYKQTNNPFWYVRRDTGMYGEYLTYHHLKEYEKDGGRFLFNVYIPTGEGETTEIDVMLISTRGIFVFESKNYSGWIFGSEKQHHWVQILPHGYGQSHKEYFYNPILQNRSHIKHLQNYIGIDIPIKSIIVFSERCTLKNVQFQNDTAQVINRQNITNTVFSLWNQMPPDYLSKADIDNLFKYLYPFTQVSNETKSQHIEHIKKQQQP